MFTTVDMRQLVCLMSRLSGSIKLPCRQPFEHRFIQYGIPIIRQLQIIPNGHLFEKTITKHGLHVRIHVETNNHVNAIFDHGRRHIDGWFFKDVEGKRFLNMKEFMEFI